MQANTGILETVIDALTHAGQGWADLGVAIEHLAADIHRDKPPSDFVVHI